MFAGVAVLAQNLPEECNRDDLVLLGSKFGDVIEVFLSPAAHPKSRSAPRDRFAAIKFRTMAGAENFIANANGTMMYGNVIRVILSRPIEKNDAEEAEIKVQNEEAERMAELKKIEGAKKAERNTPNSNKQSKNASNCAPKNIIGSTRSKRVLDPDNEVGSEYICTPAPPRLEVLLKDEALIAAEEIRSTGLEVSEVEVNDPRLVLFRMKLTRDMDAYSRAVSDALNRKAFLVPGPSQKVVKRCLAPQTRAIVEILMVSPENLVALKDDILAARQRGSIEGPIVVLPADDIERVKGIPLNRENAVSALCRMDAREIRADVKNVRHIFATADESDKLEEEYNEIRNQSSKGLESLVGRRKLTMPALVLDDVRSGDNVGALLRSAFSLGVKSILMTKTSFAGLGMRAMRVSMGAASQCSFAICENLPHVLKLMKSDLGIEVIATSPTTDEILSASRGYDNQNWALIVGNEDNGSSEETFNAASRVVKLVQAGGDSFSVSIAASICLYILREPGLDGTLPFIPDC